MRRPSTPWSGPRHAERSPRSIWRAAAPRITAGLGAHSVVVALTALTSSVPLLTALVATLVFAGITLAHHTQGRASIAGTSRPLMVPMLAGALALVGIGAGAWLIGRIVGTGAVFYCEPLVPWRIEIALFGSFVGGYLTFMAHTHPLAWAVYPLTMLALLWIAPFYGFFSAPLFLGISLNTLCSARPLPTVLLTVLNLLVGSGWARPLRAGCLGDQPHPAAASTDARTVRPQHHGEERLECQACGVSGSTGCFA